MPSVSTEKKGSVPGALFEGGGSIQTQPMYIRPTLRNLRDMPSWPRPGRPKHVTWEADTRVGAIIASVHKPDPPFIQNDRWTPPRDWEWVIKYMEEPQKSAYKARCEQWLEDHPPPHPDTNSKSKLEINHAPIQALFAKWAHKGPPLSEGGPPQPSVPPIEERVKAYRQAGHSEEYIQKAIDRAAHAVENADKRQDAIDKIFGKYPAASKSKRAAPKVIKAVKKRMEM